MVKKVPKSTNSAMDNQLLNFHFSRAPPAQQPSRTNNGHRRPSRETRQQYRRTPEDRASSRRKAASNMFPLHSSPDHAFIITRRGTSNQHYSFRGPDEAVSWEAVRIVRFLISASADAETCPICLDALRCARITKCGHCFCLPCLIHHVQSGQQQNAANAPKCPCCAIPLHLADVRPVQLVSVSVPAVNSTMTFVKLHRGKDCPAPYLPLPDQPRRAAPNSAPLSGDEDAPFCKFNYVDPLQYQQMLDYNQNELVLMQNEFTSQTPPLEVMCLGMAMEIVQRDRAQATAQAQDETELAQQFQNPSAGMYQPHPLHLMAATTSTQSEPARRSLAPTWNDGSNLLPSAADSGRPRGDSVASYGGTSVCSTGTSHSNSQRTGGGCMYMNDDEYVLYQAQDGALCFLSGFNMNCLRTEFSATVPARTDDEVVGIEGISLESPPNSPHQQQQADIRLPLPDVIEGKVVEVERVHLTADMRQRRRFLSHLPVYSDICFVEINLGHLLSRRTKSVFKKDFQKRKQARINEIKSEKRADERQRRKEEARINELKARIQRVDPMDEFFRPVIPPESEPVLSGDEFGPSISTLAAGVPGDSNDESNRNSAMSFSQIIRVGEDFPSLGAAPNETNFPALGSSPPTGTKKAPPPRPWGSAVKSLPAAAEVPAVAPRGKKTKGKGKKIVLFSTGGGHY